MTPEEKAAYDAKVAAQNDPSFLDRFNAFNNNTRSTINSGAEAAAQTARDALNPATLFGTLPVLNNITNPNLGADVKQAIGDAVQPVGDMLAPVGDVLKTGMSKAGEALQGSYPHLASAVNPNMPNAPMPVPGPDGGAPTPGAAPVPENGSGGSAHAAMNFGVPTPGVGAPKVSTKEYDAAVTEQKKLIADKVALDREALAQEEALAGDKLASQMRIEANHAKVNQVVQEKLEEAQGRQQALITKLMDPNVTVDPNRYMNSLTPGQYFLMALSNGMNGGRTMQRFQQSVDEDVRAQQQTFENRRNGLKDALAGEQTLYGMLRMQGADEREAYLGAKQAALEMFGQKADILSKRASSAGLQNAAGKAMNVLDNTKALNQQQLDQAWAQRSMTAGIAHMEELGRNNRFTAEMGMKQAALDATGAKKGEDLKGPQVQEVAGERNTIDQIAHLRDAYSKVKGDWAHPVDTMVNKAAGVLNAGSDVREYNAAKDTLAKTLARGFEGGKVTDKDFADFLIRNLPPPGDTQGMRQFEEQLKMATRGAKTTLETFKAAGFNTDELEKRLKETTDAAGVSGVKVPGERAE